MQRGPMGELEWTRWNGPTMQDYLNYRRQILAQETIIEPTWFTDIINERRGGEDMNRYDDEEQRIPKEIKGTDEIPTKWEEFDENNTEHSLDTVAKALVPEGFARKYKQMLKLQDELKKTEDDFKKKLLEVFESIPELETNSVTIDGLKFTYVKGSVRKTVDSKKLQEEMPEIYNKFLKESNVKSSIRTSVEY